MTKYLNLDIDSTLGGDNASDSVVASQKAIKTYIDNKPGGTVTRVNNTLPDSSGNVTISIPTVDQTYNSTSSNAQSGVAIAEAKFIQNTATGSSALTIDGTPSDYTGSINIGDSSQAKQNYCTALGFNANANGNSSTCIGRNAVTSASSAIQIGAGVNSTANTLQVGFVHANTNYPMLDGTTGLIPDERLSSNIARTSVQTLQSITSVTYAASQTITLTANSSIYKLVPTDNITSMVFSLAASEGASDTTAYTFELYLDISSTLRSVAFPTPDVLTWQDGVEPDLSETGVYLFAFRTMDGGTHWIGNLQGMW